MFETIQNSSADSRILTAIALTALIVTGEILVLRPHAPMPGIHIAQAPKHAAALPKKVRVTASKLPVVTPKPKPQSTAYAEEQQMGFSQLMNRWTPYVAEAAARFKVPPVWIRAVMQ